MENHKELITVSQKIIPEVALPEPSVLTKEGFIKALTPYLAELLDRDFQKLVQIMYRIDVSEKEFSLTLQPGNPKIAENLAELIFERLCLKAKIRAQYKAK